MHKYGMKLFITLDTNGNHNFVDVLPSIVTNTFIFNETFSEQNKTVSFKVSRVCNLEKFFNFMAV